MANKEKEYNDIEKLIFELKNFSTPKNNGNYEDLHTDKYGSDNGNMGIDISKDINFDEIITDLGNYWNKSVKDAITNCEEILRKYSEDSLTVDSDGNVIRKDAANSFSFGTNYVSPWKNFTEQTYLDARTDEITSVLENDKNLDYTQNYQNNVSDNITEDENSNNETLVSHLIIEDNNNTPVKINIIETNTGYSLKLTEMGASETNNIKKYCFYETDNVNSLKKSNAYLYILKVREDKNDSKHKELYFEKIVSSVDEISFFDEYNKLIIQYEGINYNVLNNLILTVNGENSVDYSGITWSLNVGELVGTVDKTEYYSVDYSISKTYRNYNIILASLTRLIMPQYKRRVEIEDLNRNFWVISQNLTMLNKFMIGLQDGIGDVFKNLFSEIIGLWDNVYRLWQAILYIYNKMDGYDKSIEEIGKAASKVKVKLAFENTFRHTGEWYRDVELQKRFFYTNNDNNIILYTVDDVGNSFAISSDNENTDDTLFIKIKDNVIFEHGDAVYFGILPLLYKEHISQNIQYTDSQGKTENIDVQGSIISLPYNSTISKNRIEKLQEEEKTENNSEIINEIFINGKRTDGKQYGGTYKEKICGELIQIERKFGNARADEILEQVRSKNFVLLSTLLDGENAAVDDLTTVIEPWLSVLQFYVDVIKISIGSLESFVKDTTLSGLKAALLSSNKFYFTSSIITQLSTKAPQKVIDASNFLLEIVEDTIEGLVFTGNSNADILYSQLCPNIGAGVVNTEMMQNFINNFYSLFQKLFNFIYTKTPHEIKVFQDYINSQAADSYKVFASNDSNVSINTENIDVAVLEDYKNRISTYISDNSIYQENGNVVQCSGYMLLKNMLPYVDPGDNNSFIEVEQVLSNGETRNRKVKIIFNSFSYTDDSENNQTINVDTYEKLEIFFDKKMKVIEWDLLSADLPSPHFLSSEEDNEKIIKHDKYTEAYYYDDPKRLKEELQKASIGTMTHAAMFKEGENGSFGTSHLYPWQNCFGLWFEFIGEPTNTGIPVVGGKIRTYTHNLTNTAYGVSYPANLVHTEIYLSPFNIYNMDITIPLSDVENCKYHDILRFGKPYPNLKNILFYKMKNKTLNKPYDHVEIINNKSNYIFNKVPTYRSNGTPSVDNNNIHFYTQKYLYTIDGYYGHASALNYIDYNSSYDNTWNQIEEGVYSNNSYIITTKADDYGDKGCPYAIIQKAQNSNYYGPNYADCQQYIISSTDLVNAKATNVDITQGKTLWENINTENNLVANISFLPSSNKEQQLGLYVSKDKTTEIYNIYGEESVIQPEAPEIIVPSDNDKDINDIPNNFIYDEWILPPRLCDEIDNDITMYSERDTRYNTNTSTDEQYDTSVKNGLPGNTTQLTHIYVQATDGTTDKVDGYNGGQSSYFANYPFFKWEYKDKKYLIIPIAYQSGGTKISTLYRPHNLIRALSCSYVGDNYPDYTYETGHHNNTLPKGTIDITNHCITFTSNNQKYTIKNIDIWKDRYDLFCWYNNMEIITENTRPAFFGNRTWGNIRDCDKKFYVLGEFKEENNNDVHEYILIPPTVDFSEKTEGYADCKKRYRSYIQWLNSYDQEGELTQKSTDYHNKIMPWPSDIELAEDATTNCNSKHMFSPWATYSPLTSTTIYKIKDIPRASTDLEPK